MKVGDLVSYNDSLPNPDIGLTGIVINQHKSAIVFTGSCTN